jgi:hypothetical protein
MWVTAGAVVVHHYSVAMPSSVDPARLVALSVSLDALRAVARDGAEEVLGHFPEVGDRATQSALDGLLEQLADTLRAIDAEAGELTGRLRIAAQSATPPRPGEEAPAGPDEAARPQRRGLFG